MLITATPRSGPCSLAHLKKHLLVFALTYLAAVLSTAILSVFFGLPGSTSAATLLAAAIITSRSFVKNEQRAPGKGEKRVLVWGSLGFSLTISAFLVAGVFLFLPDGKEVFQTSMSVAFVYYAIGLVVVCAVSLLLFHLSYGWRANEVAKSMVQHPRA